MTRRHFEDLANYLGGQYWHDDTERAKIAEVLANWCANQNSRFDDQRFIATVEEAARGAERTWALLKEGK